MVTHSGILAGIILWTEKLAGYSLWSDKGLDAIEHTMEWNFSQDLVSSFVKQSLAYI